MWPGANASPWETMEHGSPDFLRSEGFRALERLPVSLSVQEEDRRAPAAHLRDVVRDDEVEPDLLHQGLGPGLQLRRGHPRLRLEPDEDLRALPEGGEDLRGRGELEGDFPAPGRDLPCRLLRRKVADRGGHDADVRVEGFREPQEVLRRLERPRRDVVRGDRVVAAKPQLDVRALLERGLRELDPGLP